MVEHFVLGSFVFVFIFGAAFFRSINLDFVLIFRLQFTKFHAFFFCFFDIVVELIKRMVDLNRSLLNLCSKSISAAIKLFFDWIASCIMTTKTSTIPTMLNVRIFYVNAKKELLVNVPLDNWHFCWCWFVISSSSSQFVVFFSFFLVRA